MTSSTPFTVPQVSFSAAVDGLQSIRYDDQCVVVDTKRGSAMHIRMQAAFNNGENILVDGRPGLHAITRRRISRRDQYGECDNLVSYYLDAS